MWISIQTKQVELSQRMRRNIEAHVQRIFGRERRQVASLVVAIEPAKVSRAFVAFTCQIRLWSSFLGLVTVTDAGDTIRTAVQQAGLRARHVARRRLHKRRNRKRRFSRFHLSP